MCPYTRHAVKGANVICTQPGQSDDSDQTGTRSHVTSVVNGIVITAAALTLRYVGRALINIP